MKKADIVLFISLLILFLMMIIGVIFKCYIEQQNNKEPLTTKAENETIEYKDLNSCIIADSNTHILYYYSVHYMCPYYSKNGKLCKYENGKIIEVMQ